MNTLRPIFTSLLIVAGIALVPAKAIANTYGSVEPLANPTVLDTTTLREQSLGVRKAFAKRLLQCGVVEDVVSVLSWSDAISTINALNSSVELTAGGFQGETNPAYAYTVIDSGPNAVSFDDIKIVTNSLGYVFSQGSAFLLDADDPSSYDFPANYVVLNFSGVPSLEESAALFETVGQIDPELFSTDSSGYTQFGFGYLSLQSFVPDQQFIDGYVVAATAFGVEYTPIVNGIPALFSGGAAFPGNDWNVKTAGEDYLARIPTSSHRALGKLRGRILRFTKRSIRIVELSGSERQLRRLLLRQRCPSSR
ncbi:MAG: hypothetical protein ACR2P1_16840 [Pseudomonadales bacterium]